MAKKMIDQGFNYKDSTVKDKIIFLWTRVKSLEPREDKKKLSNSSKIKIKKKNSKKIKSDDYDCSVVEPVQKSFAYYKSVSRR